MWYYRSVVILERILEILITYWKPIVGLLFTIAGFIIAVCKKKPVTDIFSDITLWCIAAVNYAEALDINDGLKGESKLLAALTYVLDRMRDKYPTLEVERYSKMIQSTIETILSTPHKKG